MGQTFVKRRVSHEGGDFKISAWLYARAADGQWMSEIRIGRSIKAFSEMAGAENFSMLYPSFKSQLTKELAQQHAAPIMQAQERGLIEQ